MKAHFLTRAVFLAMALLAVSPRESYAGKSSPTPVKVYIYNQVVDEHNTDSFYGAPPLTYCAGTAQMFSQQAACTGDSVSAGPATVWDTGSPWSSTADLSTKYISGTNCDAANATRCVQSQFNSDNKTLSLEIRGTAPTRTLNLDFRAPCPRAEGCPAPAGDPTVFGGDGLLTTPALLNIFLHGGYDGMVICSSEGCPEAEIAVAKLWFDEPAGTNWRVDWTYIRVLRVSQTKWYFIADACDGTQIAGLSKLVGERTRPKTVLNGFYKIPFLIVVEK